VSEGEHHVKHDDEIDECHKSQLKFEYDVYLLNYTIETKNLEQPKLSFWVFLDFQKSEKNLGFLKPNSTALR